MSSVETVAPTAPVQRTFEILNHHDVPSLVALAAEDLAEH